MCCRNCFELQLISVITLLNARSLAMKRDAHPFDLRMTGYTTLGAACASGKLIHLNRLILCPSPDLFYYQGMAHIDSFLACLSPLRICSLQACRAFPFFAYTPSFCGRKRSRSLPNTSAYPSRCCFTMSRPAHTNVVDLPPLQQGFRLDFSDRRVKNFNHVQRRERVPGPL